MTRDDIIELALQCGIWIPIARGPERALTIHKLCRLATLVAAAERDALRAAVRHEADCVEAAKAERDALRAKVEAMEQQRPFAWIVRGGYPVPLENLEWQLLCGAERPTLSWTNQEMRPLYALPGAKGEKK